MAAGDLALNVLITGNASGLKGAVGQAVQALMSMSAGDAVLAGLAVGGAAVAAGLAIVGVVSVKMAGDFQQGMNRLVTGAGDATDNMAKLGQGILATSVQTGVLTTGSQGLIAAMYLIISSGQRGAQALNTLTVAAQGAQIEQANVVDVANVLSGVMTNYGTKTYNATQFMNGLVKAVQQGKITLQQLSVAMGPIDPIAKMLGISFNDIAAAMTTQTNAMIPAQRAATGLRFMMQALENPTHKATSAMAAMGLKSADVANEMKVSLPGALEMIYNAAKRAGPEGSVPFNRAFQDMVGGMRSWSTAAALTGPHFKDFVRNSQLIKEAMEKSKSAVMGWQLAQSGFNIQMDRAKAAIQAVLINIGLQLLPVLTQIVAKIAPVVAAIGQWILKNDIIGKAIGFFSTVLSTIGTIMGPVVAVFLKFMGILGQLINWVQHNQEAMQAFKIIAIALGVIISVGLTLALIAVGVILAGLAIVIGVVVGVIMGIIWVVRHWGDIMHWIGGIISAVGTFIHGVLTDLKNWFGSIFSAIGSKVHDALTALKNDVGAVFNSLGTTIRTALTSLKNFIGGIFSAIGTTVHDAMTWLYNHNTYVKRFCDLVMQRFADLKQNVGTIFSAIGTFIHDKLIWIQQTAGSIFSAMGTKIHDVLTGIKNFVGSIFSAIGTFIHDKLIGAKNDATGIFGAMGSAIGSKANDIKNIVGNAFSALGTAMHDKLTSAWNWVKGFVSGWPTDAFNWGKSLIQGLINGIGSMFSALGSAVSGVMGKIGGILGFHSSVFGTPKEGPGKNADQWMPALMRGLANGIYEGTPMVQRALAGVFVAPNTSTLGRSFSVSGGSGWSTSGGHTIIYVTPPAPTRVAIEVDKRELGHTVMSFAAHEMRVQGNIRNR